MSTFAERIKELRLERGMTQDSLGQVIGVKSYSIYTYEKGRSAPSIEDLITLADFFNVSVDYLIGHTDKREVNR